MADRFKISQFQRQPSELAANWWVRSPAGVASRDRVPSGTVQSPAIMPPPASGSAVNSAVESTPYADGPGSTPFPRGTAKWRCEGNELTIPQETQHTYFGTRPGVYGSEDYGSGPNDAMAINSLMTLRFWFNLRISPWCFFVLMSHYMGNSYRQCVI